LITQDKDFGELVFRLKNAHFGVILIRLTGYNSNVKADIVVKVLLEHKNELYNAFTVIQPTLVRIRK
jgi:predicted nuclease of predicted toxin-antitoxin system